MGLGHEFDQLHSDGETMRRFLILLILALPVANLAQSTLNCSGGLCAPQEVTRYYFLSDSPATWTKPSSANFNHVRVIVTGPGGGGGGSGTNDAMGGGGGGGAWAMKKIVAASLGSTVTITIGSGGAFGAAGNNAGSAGSAATSFGAHVSAGAGNGGNAGNASAGEASGGTASGGDINLNGGIAGPNATGLVAFDTTHEFVGWGGAAGGQGSALYYINVFPKGSLPPGVPWAARGAIRVGNEDPDNAGANGEFPGGGASGGWRATVSQAGGTGANGMAIVTEVYQ